jgi:murein DD-endopeptidase MepM/ murein hydrolase activator NlpD
MQIQESRRYLVKKGDRLLNVLIQKLGLTPGSVHLALEELKKVFYPIALKDQQEIFVIYGVDVSLYKGTIQTLLPLENLKILDHHSHTIFTVYKNSKGKFTAQKSPFISTTHHNRYLLKIHHNLYTDAIKSGIPLEIITQLLNIYSFDVDFQRDIKIGDTLEVVFTSLLFDQEGGLENGDIIYANLVVSGVPHAIYRFEYNDTATYFDKNGSSIQKSLLKTPVNGARITSRYGTRRHPVLGYTRKHQGIDFAVPLGTPFYAAGDGTVKKIINTCPERNRSCGNGYGNYLLIRHNSIYSSEYAHIHKVAKHLKIGSRVKQGEIIGFVGNTGLSTGPHLHYGIIHQNKRVNPANIKPIIITRLTGDKLKKFNHQKNKIDNFRNYTVHQKESLL